jgi:hypothetical protein
MSNAFRTDRKYTFDTKMPNGTNFTDDKIILMNKYLNELFNETRNSEFLLLEHDATLDSSRRRYNKISRKPAGSPAIPVWSSPKKSTGGRRLRLKPAAE